MTIMHRDRRFAAKIFIFLLFAIFLRGGATKLHPSIVI
jgi:hypothetical protein